MNQLTALYLFNTHLIFDADNNTIGSTNHNNPYAPIRLFKELAKNGSQLQVIELDMMQQPATEQLLKAIAHYKSLKKLRMELNSDLLSDERFTVHDLPRY